MLSLRQKWIPGIVGISTYVDYAYQKEIQLYALREAGGQGPVNQLRTACVTLDFNRLIENLRGGQREAAEEQVTRTVEALAAAGADFIVVTSGTTSTLTATARRKVSLPFLDLGEAAWKEVPNAGGAVGILATGELEKQGAASIILGNTDMTLACAELTKSAAVPLVDAALAHARAAARAALGGEL